MQEDLSTGVYKVRIIVLAGRDDYLRGLGVSEDVISYVMAQDDKVSVYYANALRKAPTMTLEELLDIELPNMPVDVQKFELEIVFQEYRWGVNVLPDDRTARWFVMETRKKLRQRNLYPVDVMKFGDNIEYRNEFRVELDRLESIQFWDWRRAFPHVDLTGMGLDDAINLSIKWHESFKNGGDGSYLETSIFYGPEWKGEDGKKIDSFTGWTIREITTKNDLVVEGKKMGHCCGSYWNDYEGRIYGRSGLGRIFSLRDKRNEPHVTLETDSSGSYCYQIQGKENSRPDEEYIEMIKYWNLYGNSPLKMFEGEEEKDIPMFSSRYDNLKGYGQKLEEFFSEIGMVNEYGLIDYIPDIEDITDRVFTDLKKAVSDWNDNGWRSDLGVGYSLIDFVISHGSINEIKNLFYYNIQKFNEESWEDFNSNLGYLPTPDGDEDDEEYSEEWDEYNRQLEDLESSYWGTGFTNSLYEDFGKILLEKKKITMDEFYFLETNAFLQTNTMHFDASRESDEPFNIHLVAEFADDELKEKIKLSPDNFDCQKQERDLVYICDFNNGIFYYFKIVPIKNKVHAFNLKRIRKT